MKETKEKLTKAATRTFFFLLIASALLMSGNSASAGEGRNKWSGVDESVVEKVAEEHGRKAREPFINTDQGDLLIFVFLTAGAAGGFIFGYNFRKLFYETKSNKAGHYE